MRAAASIGDDRLQRAAGLKIPHPAKYTHGTSKQRVYFFTRGLKTGDASMATLQKFFDAPMDRNGELQEF